MSKEFSLDDILMNINNKFELVNVVARRAKALNNGADRMIPSDRIKPVSIALEEIFNGKIKAKPPLTKEGK